MDSVRKSVSGRQPARVEHLTLPKALKEHIDKRVAEGEFLSLDDYIRALVRADCDYRLRREDLLRDIDAGLADAEAWRVYDGDLTCSPRVMLTVSSGRGRLPGCGPCPARLKRVHASTCRRHQKHPYGMAGTRKTSPSSKAIASISKNGVKEENGVLATLFRPSLANAVILYPLLVAVFKRRSASTVSSMSIGNLAISSPTASLKMEVPLIWTIDLLDLFSTA